MFPIGVFIFSNGVLGLLAGGARVGYWFGVSVWGMGFGGGGGGAGLSGGVIGLLSREGGFDWELVWGLRFEVVGFIVEESDSSKS